MKTVRNIFLAIWTLGCLRGTIKNISNYNIGEFIIAILVTVSPFLVLWIRARQRKKSLIIPKEKWGILKSVLYFIAILWVLGAAAAISDVILGNTPDKLPICMQLLALAALPFEIYAIIKSTNRRSKKAIYFIGAWAFFIYILALASNASKNSLSNYAVAFLIMAVSASYVLLKKGKQRPPRTMVSPTVKTADLSILEIKSMPYKEER